MGFLTLLAPHLSTWLSFVSVIYSFRRFLLACVCVCNLLREIDRIPVEGNKRVTRKFHHYRIDILTVSQNSPIFLLTLFNVAHAPM
jgi:hypothetical protein